jgi:Domain of unknown function (DUF1707)
MPPDRAAAMRTSEAERQRVADFLRDCCAEGRLTPEELEERLDRLFAGGTVADLRRLVTDLPGGHAVVPRHAPPPAFRILPEPPRRRSAPGVVAVLGFAFALVLFMSLPWFVKAMVAGTAVIVGFVVAVTLVPIALTLWFLAWLASRLARTRSNRT